MFIALIQRFGCLADACPKARVHFRDHSKLSAKIAVVAAETVTLCVAVLLAVVKSPGNTEVTEAEFDKAPVKPLSTVPEMVNTRELPAPLFRALPVKLTLLPAVALVPQVAVPLATQLTVTPVIAAGTASPNAKLVALSGPALVTVTV